MSARTPRTLLVFRELLLQAGYRVKTPDVINLIDQITERDAALDEANAIIAALVQGGDNGGWIQAETNARYNSMDYSCGYCGRPVTFENSPQGVCDHAPDCPVGRALARVGKAAT